MACQRAGFPNAGPSRGGTQSMCGKAKQQKRTTQRLLSDAVVACEAKTRPQTWNQACTSHTCSAHFAPTQTRLASNTACRRVGMALQVPTSSPAPQVAQIWPKVCRFRAKVCRFRATCGQFRSTSGRNWAQIDRVRAKFGGSRANVRGVRQILVDVGSFRIRFGRCRAMLVDSEPTLVDFGPVWPLLVSLALSGPS